MKKAVLFLGIGLGLLSCSEKENLPTEELAKQEIIELIKEESNDKIELLEFKKIDGLKEKRNEVDFYVIDFDGKISYKQDAYSQVNEDYVRTKGFLIMRDDKPSVYERNSYKYEKVKKGQERNIKGQIGFVKKENGWKNIKVYMYLQDKM